MLHFSSFRSLFVPKHIMYMCFFVLCCFCRGNCVDCSIYCCFTILRAKRTFFFFHEWLLCIQPLTRCYLQNPLDWNALVIAYIVHVVKSSFHSTCLSISLLFSFVFCYHLLKYRKHHNLNEINRYEHVDGHKHIHMYIFIYIVSPLVSPFMSIASLIFNRLGYFYN